MGPAVGLLKVGGVDLTDPVAEEDLKDIDVPAVAVVMGHPADGHTDIPLAQDVPLDLNEITRIH